MVLLRKEQVKERVTDAVIDVGEELVQYKGNFLTPNRSAASSGNIFTDDYSVRDYLRPMTIGRRFSVQELTEKIRIALNKVGLENLDFEFAVETTNPPTVERQSQNYIQEAIAF